MPLGDGGSRCGGGAVIARQDVLRGVRWYRPEVPELVEETGRYVDEADIPTGAHVHALAKSAATQSGVWWRQLEILLVAYSGLRWGEHAALTADRVDPVGRRIVVDRQVIETNQRLTLSPPENRRRSHDDVPGAHTARRRAGDDGDPSPSGDTAGFVAVPLARGRWPRRSNYRGNVFAPAARWPLRPDGRLVWTFHSLRHVFATWALSQPGARIEDVSRLMGHSSVRITQDIYVSPDRDLFDRFDDLTK